MDLRSQFVELLRLRIALCDARLRIVNESASYQENEKALPPERSRHAVSVPGLRHCVEPDGSRSAHGRLPDPPSDLRSDYGIDDAQACVDWLKETNSLKLAGIKPDEVPNYLDYMLSLSPEKEAEELGFVRNLVEERWYEIEGKMLTPRTKYSNGG
jgi:hypothetical protein